MIKQLIFTGIILLFFSCNKTPVEIKKDSKKDSIHVVSKTYVQSVFLTEIARKELVKLKYFDEFEKNMNVFYHSKPADIKFNAKDLSDIIFKIKDSITVEKINQPDVKARFNILYNETLRLQDMSTINTITDDEVKLKIENIIYAYESIIAKINQVFMMKANEDNVDVRFQAPKVLKDSLPKQEILKTEKPTKIKNQ